MLEATAVSQERGEYQDSITLDFEQRCKRRQLMRTDTGVEFLLNLPTPITLQAANRLRLSDGSFILIKAAAEEVLDIHTKDSVLLARLAWSLGNKHLPVEVTASTLRVRYDAVVEKECLALGLAVTLVRHQNSFSPNGSL